MRQILIIALCAIWQLSWSQNNIEQLELISISQLVDDDDRRFDLSGLVCVNGKYFIIADKQWNNFIYEIRFTRDYWYIAGSSGFNIGEDELGMEAIEYCDGLFYMANEDNGLIYSKSPNGEINEYDIKFAESNVQPGTWGNAGWEGLAINCEDGIMYLAKERQPRYVLEVDMESREIVDKFNIPEIHSNDFSDTKYENGYLYLLERNGNYVTKVDLKTNEVVSKYSYRHICSYPEPNGKLYDDEKYGMAEALILTENEIWLGIDNNGNTVSKYAHRTYDLHGKKPVIIKFKRPDGF